MADDDMIQDLRDATAHRGLRLVRSRKRTPGVGDFGKFGLADKAGKPVFGIAAKGALTATAEAVRDYLRGNDVATWQSSAKAVAKDKPRAKTKSPPPPKEARPEPKPPAAKARETQRYKEAPTPRAAPKPPPPPPLRLRPAKATDAAAIARLLGGPTGAKPGPDAVRAALALPRARGGTILAERGDPIGCVAFALLPTPHRGTIGRITLLFVAEDERRAGIGRSLFDAACERLSALGCATIEAISDIDIRNAHGFFRALGMRQASYRFTADPPRNGI